VLTKREWVILQQALATYRNLLDVGPRPSVAWDDERDGPVPTPHEIDGLAEKVGDLPHED
jgi:hypothetical protein